MKTRRFDFNFRPLQINIGFAVDGSVPSTQNYDADTATYTPDYTLTPLIIQPQVSCMDKDEVLQAGSINHQLANIKWYEITGGVSTLIQSTDTHYEITASGSNAGRIKVKKNAQPRTPITLEFHAEFCDPRTGQIHRIIRTFLIKCTNATMSPPQLLLDAADQTPYNPLTDPDEQTVHASLRVGMHECPVANRAFVWDVYRTDTDTWTKVGADTTLDYDVEVAADGASCKVNRALMGHELHLRCRAKYDANGVSAKTVAINASAPAFVYADDFKTLVGQASIRLTASVQGITAPTYKWSYKQEGQTKFTVLPSYTTATFEFASNGQVMGSAKSSIVRCTVNDSVYDEVTIVKVSSGTAVDTYLPNLIEGTSNSEWVGITTSRNSGLVALIPVSKLGLNEGETITFSADIKTESGKKLRPRIQWYNSEDDRFSDTAIEYVENGEKRIAVTSTVLNGYQTMMLYLDSNLTSYEHPESTTEYVRSVYLCRGTSTQWAPAASEMISADGYTCVLANESHAFGYNAETGYASSTECGVIAYKDAVRMPVTIGLITGAPAGMTVSVQNNNSISAQFTVVVTTALGTNQGVLKVPVTVDGKKFIRKFSWSLSLADATLTDAAPCKVVSFIRRIPKFEYDITGVPVNIPADILAIAPEASIWDANGAITDPERELLPLWYIATNKASGTLSYTQVAHGMTPIISTSAMSDNYGAVLGLDVVDAGPLCAMEDSDGSVFEDGDGNIILIK